MTFMHSFLHPQQVMQGGCTPLLALGVGCISQCRAGSGGAPRRRHLRVLVDMDGVLVDFKGGFLKKFRAKYPEKPFISLEDRRGLWVSEQHWQLEPELSVNESRVMMMVMHSYMQTSFPSLSPQWLHNNPVNQTTTVPILHIGASYPYLLKKKRL